jgi:type I restriction enzyme S subunit
VIEWPYVPIEEVSLRVAMGPFGSSIKVSTFVSSGIPVISGQHLRGSRLYDFDYNFVTEAHADQLAKANVQRGDVILTHAGNIGQVAYIPQSSQYERYVISQRQFYIRCDPSRLIPEFLVYYFESHEGRHRLLANANQTGVPSLSQPVTYIRKVEIPLPSLAEQRAISDVLGGIDDKIESNRRMTATIEKLVPLIFQSMTSESELKLLPEVAKLQKGISYRSADLEDSETAMVTLKSFDRNGGYKSNGLKPYIGKYKPEQVLLSGEMAVAQTDLTQGAEVVGRVIRIPSQENFQTLVASLDLVIVRPLDAADEAYLYGALLQEDFREHCRSRTSGTTVLHLGSDALPKYLIPWADGGVRSAFADEVQPLLEEHDSLTKESATLERLRDALLPELLSGRLRVKDAESIVENV